MRRFPIATCPSFWRHYIAVRVGGSPAKEAIQAQEPRSFTASDGAYFNRQMDYDGCSLISSRRSAVRSVGARMPSGSQKFAELSQSMSNSMSVVVDGGPIPDGVVPSGYRSFGQNLKPYSALASLARELGLAPLDDFVVDHCGLVEEGLREAGWREPEGPEEWGDVIPIDDSPITDPKDLAAMEEYGRIVEQAEAKWSWFSPSEGLKTVRGLINALESRPDLNERFYGAVWDLQDFEYKLAYAERRGLKFHFGVSY